MIHNSLATSCVRVATALSTAAVLSGCVIAIGNDGGEWSAGGPEVYASEMRELVTTNRAITLGQTREQVLDETALGEYASKFAVREVGGQQIEEWRVQARHDGTRFVRWYYFVDGTLRALADERIDLADAEAAAWTEPPLAG